MEVPSYVVGAFLFGAIYGSIQYVIGNITDFYVLSVHVLVFGVLGSGLSWVLTQLFKWYKDRK